MAEKGKTPFQPDKGMAKAYLREFKGWSTAFPPGLSDPTSLRDSRNVMITREGGARVRPALRSVLTKDVWLDANFNARLVGGWDRFFLNDGTKALLFAVREASGAVSFRVAKYNDSTDRFDIISLAEAGFTLSQTLQELNFTSATTFVTYLQIDNKIFALSDGGEDVRMFNVGANKSARKVTELTVPAWPGDSPAPNPANQAPTIVHPDAAWINGAQTTIPTAETPTNPASPAVGTLISSTAADNSFNYGFFYTFENEIGESKPSPIARIKARRAWSQWQFFAPDSSGNKSNTAVIEPNKAMDQLVAIIPTAVFNAAKSQRAIRMNLYMFTWSDQAPVPAEAVLVASRAITTSSPAATHGWLQNTAAIPGDSVSSLIPTKDNRSNFSTPPGASQGLVSGDRMILVNDRRNGALIQWSSNLTDNYTNFSPSKGGGRKTLTSGNLLIPVCAKLWQNPQSVDTITILCSGVDGYSTSFYMAPAEIQNQSSTATIMSFEETTATPGTVSPYGVEIHNNALYHPLDTELMKSTANNYKISHRSVTDDIANKWAELVDKKNIISTQHDNRLYYLVHNPEGEELLDGCMGNELWVFDGAQDEGTWVRWLVQGISLSRLEIEGKLHVALARPEGIFVFDEYKLTDDVSASGGTLQRPIEWHLETNTQGANRAHDAWAYLQQANVTFGNFRGAVKYGIRGKDVHGKVFDKYKISRFPFEPGFDHLNPLSPNTMPFDHDDYWLLGITAKEWYFYAESVQGEQSGPALSYGQINFVQYMFTPMSVNLNYQNGSIETFEYGRDRLGAASSQTFNGVPYPVADSQRL